MIYLQLLWSYLKIGFFGFGGGYAMLSLIQNEIVVRNGWLTETQFADIVAVSQATPGPIAINSATYVGYAVTGNVWGAVIATIAVSLPALTIMMIAVKFYLRLAGNKYLTNVMWAMNPVVVGMIAAAAAVLITPETLPDFASIAITFGALFVAIFFKRINPIWIIVASAIAGIAIYN